MTLDKSVKHKKEKRKPYKDSRAFDYSCRHGGSCTYCSENRQFSNKRRMPAESEKFNKIYVDTVDTE